MSPPQTNDFAHLLAPRAQALVGTVHLPALAGPDAPTVDALLERAERDARAYAQAGFDAVIVENFGDAPYPKDHSDPHVPAVMARAVAVASRCGLPVGANVLRNDARSAIAACYAGGGNFVRINVFSGAAVTDQGIIEGDAHGVIAYRRLLGADRGASRVYLLADVDVKHSAQLARRPLDQLAADTAYRAGADALLVTGGRTGDAADLAEVDQVAAGAPGTPVWVASGVTPKNVAHILRAASGVIVGTIAKKDGRVTEPVDPARAAEVARAAGKQPRSG